MKSQQLHYSGADLRILRVEQSDQQPIDVSAEVADHYLDRNSFNYLFIDFASLFSLDKYQERSQVVSKNDYISENVRQPFEVLKKLANQEKAFTPKDSKGLLDAFYSIYSILNERYKWLESDRFLVPLKGGGVVTTLFEIPEEKVLSIDSKRLPLKEGKGRFGFGMHIDKPNRDETLEQAKKFFMSINGKRLAILEVCVMSGMTTCAYLLDLHLQNIKPKKISLVASVVSEQGMARVNNFAAELGFEVEWVTARVVNTMGDFYTELNDVLLNEDGSLILKSPWDAYSQLKGLNT